MREADANLPLKTLDSRRQWPSIRVTQRERSSSSWVHARTLSLCLLFSQQEIVDGNCQESEEVGKESGQEVGCQEGREEGREESSTEEGRQEEKHAQAKCGVHEATDADGPARRYHRLRAAAAHRGHEQDLGIHQEEQASGLGQP